MSTNQQEEERDATAKEEKWLRVFQKETLDLSEVKLTLQQWQQQQQQQQEQQEPAETEAADNTTTSTTSTAPTASTYQSQQQPNNFLTMALYHVCRRPNPPLDIVQYLVQEQGAPVNGLVAKNSWWLTTPLHTFCEYYDNNKEEKKEAQLQAILDILLSPSANTTTKELLQTRVTLQDKWTAHDDGDNRVNQGYLPLHAALIRNQYHYHHLHDAQQFPTAEGSMAVFQQQSNATIAPIPGMIQRLLQACPETIRQCDGDGNTPFHLACQYSNNNNNVRQLLQYLYDLYPRANQMTNRHKRRPLHMACASSSSSLSLETLQFLLRLDEQEQGTTNAQPLSLAVHQSDQRELYPLQIAAQCSQSKAVVQTLVEYSMNNHNIPALLTNRIALDVVHRAIYGIGGTHYNQGTTSSHANQDGSENDTDDPPTQATSSSSLSSNKKPVFPHLDMILYLIRTFPGQVRQKGLPDYYQRGTLPLHLLLAKKSTSGVISQAEMATLVKELVQSYPESVQQSHHEYGLPIVQACQGEHSALVIDALMPPSTSDATQQHPLEFALDHCPNLNTIIYLVDQLYPKIVQQFRNKEGQTLLHLACRILSNANASLGHGRQYGHDALEIGIEHDGSQTMELDPSHIASVISFLRKRFPEATLLADHENGDLPIHIACRDVRHNNMDILSAVTKSCPQAWKTPNQKGELPLHVLLTYDEEWWTLPKSKLDLLVKCIDRYPAALTTRTATGDLPLHCLFKWPKGIDSGSASRVESAFLQHKLVKRFRPRSSRGGRGKRRSSSKPETPEAGKDSGQTENDKMGLLTDGKSNTPLHLAASHATPAVVEQVVNSDQANQGMVRHFNSDGLLPLHVACQASSSVATNNAESIQRLLNVIELLIKAWPTSVGIKSRESKSQSTESTSNLLPLHFASLGPYPKPDIVRFLLTKHPL